MFGSPIKLSIQASCIVPNSVTYTSSLITSLQYTTAVENLGGLKGKKSRVGVNNVNKLNKTGMEKK
ncbi:hypothetical protein OAQ96_01690 [Alphaproteobacteria bacterium]|nr:hypothetical protein [Alphaproteobacteria bacterium]